MTTTWIGSQGGSWRVPADWTNGIPNSSTADAAIATTGSYTITIGAAETDLLDSLALSDGGAVLAIQGKLSFGGALNTLDLAAGTLLLSGTLAGATILSNGGTLTLASGATLDGITYDGTLALTPGSTVNVRDGLTVVNADGSTPGSLVIGGSAGTGFGANETLTLLDSETLDNVTISIGYSYNSPYYGSGVAGTDTISNTATTNGAGATLTFGPGATLSQTTGHVYLSGNEGGYAPYNSTLVNNGEFNLLGGTLQSTNATFTNAGIITLAGSEVADIDATSFSNTGEIDFTGPGTLRMNRDNTALAGAGSTFTNDGEIDIGSGDSVLLGAASIDNEGVVNVASGGTFGVYGGTTSVSLGLVSVAAGGTLDLGVSDTLADLATVGNQGELLVSGTLDLQGGTLDVAPGGNFSNVVVTGTIKNGTIKPDGGTLTLASGATLDGVTYDGTLALTPGNTLNVRDGLTVYASDGSSPGTINLTGTSETLSIFGTTTLDHATINIGNASGYDTIRLGGDQSGETVTLGAGLTVVQAGKYATINQVYASTLVNDGSIMAGISGGTFQITSQTFTNAGTISVTNGDTLFISAVTFTNLSGSALTGGVYVVGAGAALYGSASATIGTLNADVTLSGAGSNFYGYTSSGYTAIDATLGSISSGGDLRLLSGRNFTATNAINDAGLLQLGGGTLTAPSLTVAGGGSLAGFGKVGPTSSNAITLNGTVEASGGTLDIADSVSGSGSATIDSGATLELGGLFSDLITFAPGGTSTLALDAPGDAAAAELQGMVAGDRLDFVNTAVTSAVLNGRYLSVVVAGTTYNYLLAASLPGLSAVVTSDQHGGSFVTLSTQIYAAAIALVNTPSPIAFGNVHVGASVSTHVSVTNAATSPAESLDATISASGSATASGAVTLLAAGQTDTTDLQVGLNTATAGPKSGTVVISPSSDGSGVDGRGQTALPTQTLNVTGSVYRLASGSATAPQGGILHVGDAGSATLVVANTAVRDGYSEGLRVTAVSSGGSVTASGSTGLLAAGGIGGIGIAFSTATAGLEQGQISVVFTSDGTGTSGLGTTDLGIGTVTAAVTVDNYAVEKIVQESGTPVLSGAGLNYTLNFGTVALGSSPETVTLGVENAAQAIADVLGGSVNFQGDGEISVYGFLGFSNLGAQQTAQGLDVSLDTSQTGTFSETITVTGHGSNASGYVGPNQTATITVTGTVAALASAQVNTPSLDFGNVRKGTTQEKALSISNLATPPAGSLDVDASSSGDVSVSGSGPAIAPGATDSSTLVATLDTTTGGVKEGKVDLAFSSQNADGSVTPLPSQAQSVGVSGTVYQEATSDVTIDPSEAIRRVRESGDGSLTVHNTAPAPYSEDLSTTIEGISGDVSFGSAPGLLAAGTSGQISYTIDTAAAGLVTGEVQLGFASDGTSTDGAPLTPINSKNVTLNLTVDNLADPVLEGPVDGVIDLGTAVQGDPALIQDMYALNNAPVGAPADTLGGYWEVISNDNFYNVGFDPFSGIGAGETGGGGTIALDTDTVGSFTEELEFVPYSYNASEGALYLSPEIVDVVGTIVAPTGGEPIGSPPDDEPTSAGAYGCPHFTTFDGAHFDFQGAGEFVLSRSTVPGDSFQVQVRIEPEGSSTSSVSIITQVAVQVGADRVTFEAGRDQVVWVDGTAVHIDDAHPVFTLAGGTVTRVSDNDYRVVLNTGEVVTILPFGDGMGVSMALAPGAQPGSVQGFLGADEGQDKEYQLPDGTVLTQPLSQTDFYQTYANAWRVTDSTSLLDYQSGQTTATFTDTQYPREILTLADLPPDLVAAAAKLVAAAGITDPTLAADAEFDYVTMGDPRFITQDAAVAAIAPKASTPVVLIDPVAPPPSIGILADNSEVRLAPSGTTQVSFVVNLTSAATTDTVVDYTLANGIQSAGSGETFFSAADFGGTAPSGSVTIAAGAREATVTVTLPAGALGNAPEKWLQLQVSSPAGDPVYSATAQSEVINNKPVAGTPAQPSITLLTGSTPFVSEYPAVLTPNSNGYTLNLGNVLTNAVLSPLQFAIVNAAAPGADSLSSTVTGIAGTGFQVYGTQPGLLAPGASSSGLYLQPSTAALGAQSESFVLTSNETNGSGYSAALANLTVTVTDNVIDPAKATLGTTEIDFTPVRVGTAESQSFSVTNAAGAGAAPLDVQLAAGTGAFATGSVALLAPGSSDGTDLSAGLDTSKAGLATGTVAVNLFSDLGNGVKAAVLPSQTVTVKGKVYREATAAVAAPAPFITHVGQTASIAVSVANTAASDGFSENLVGTASGLSSGITASQGTTGEIAAGAAGSVVLQVTPTTSGTFTGSASVVLASDGSGTDGLGTVALGQQSVTLSGSVYNYASALLEDAGPGTLTGSGTSYSLNLGTIAQGASLTSAVLDLRNIATGLADSLVATSTLSGTSSAFVNSGLGTIGPVAAGQASGQFQIGLKTGSAGTFSEVLTLALSSTDSAGATTLAPVTVTVTGTVAAPAGQVFTLTSGTDTVSGNAGANSVIAAAGTLSHGDSIAAGSGGSNTLALQGAGVFDLTQPATLTGLSTITAQEGQASSVSGGKTYVSQVETVYLRNGLDATVNVAAASVNAGNPKPATITIFGAQNHDVINLSSGNDTVTMGIGETLNGGTGNDTILVTAATIGDTINGGTGSSTLWITGGGQLLLGSNISNVATVYLASATSAYNVTANAISGLVVQDASTGLDTIAAGGANQTLTGGAAGMLTMVGGLNTIFKDTAALLNSDTIVNFAVGDTIDITGLKFTAAGTGAGQTSLSFHENSGGTAGSLAILVGGSPASTLNLAGNFNPLKFSAASDGNGGTLVVLNR